MEKSKDAYHHGDLRAACLRAARELLEEDGSGSLSIRAVARRAGVSPAAPYRHYADRDALVQAVAAQGYRELAEELVAAHPEPSTAEDLAAVAVAYVRFAVDHPALYRLMFADPRTPHLGADCVEVTAAVYDYLAAGVRRTFPGAEPKTMSIAVWGLVHGLASLHLDGKFAASSAPVLAERVRGAALALLGTASPKAH